ncbi:MAG: helicase-exonuclease AddAB subunit AddB [Ruminococcus sp.]|jgi:ATP-dependent helicase/nuclease subunit B
MPLQLIAGSSGAGKSHWIYEKIIKESMANPRGTYLLVVPEQFTMQAQSELVAMHPRHAVLNIDIISFQRLAYRIFNEVGGDLKPLLDDTGKSLVLQKIAQKNRKQLAYLGGNLKKPGYIDEMKSMISELAQYRLKAEDLDRLIELAEEKSLLRGKLMDVQTIYRQFTEYMNERYVTPEEILDVLCRVIDRSKLVKDSVVVLDGFTGFTPVQNQVVGKLLKLSRRTYVTVTIDRDSLEGKKLKNQQLFFMSQETIRRLYKMAQDNGVEIYQPVYINEKAKGRFKNSPEMAFLENNLFRVRGKQYEKEPDSISIRASSDPREEMEETSSAIRRLIREKGYRYRDVAVVTGDLPGYESYVIQAFEKENIPYFLDRKQSVLMNPFVEYIRAVLDMAAENFSYESVFRYLRTGMSGISRDEADLLENYVLAFGVRGFAGWNREFTKTGSFMTEGDLEELNRIRQVFVEEVKTLTEELKNGNHTVAERTAALYHFIVRSDIQKKLKKQELMFQRQGRAALVKEYAQIYGIVMEFFDKLTAVLGEESVTLGEYQQILETGFLKVQVGIIPPAVDQVVVGDVQRTRLAGIRALFFVGVNDGVIPQRSSRGGILTEAEREYLKERKVELAPTEREDMGIQRFYLYLNMTKPSERLYLSYTHTRPDGSTGGPAYLIHTVKKMFPQVRITEKEEGVFAYDHVESPVQGLSMVVQGLEDAVQGKEDSRFRELFSWYVRNSETRPMAEQLLKATFYENTEDSIGKAAAQALYGKVMENSATRLERFAACAFAHFLQYGLKLKDRVYYEFNDMDLGNVLHESLERFARLLKKENLSWKTVPEEIQEDLLNQSLEGVLEEEGYDVLKRSARDLYMVQRLKRLLKRSIWALKEQLKCGDFEPGDFEVAFEMDNRYILSLPLSGDEQMRVRGRIDRIDICEEPEECYVRVIDYKSGSRALNLTEVYHGLSLQLVVYLNAAEEIVQKQYPGKKIRPAGIFYYRIQDPLLSLSWDQKERDVEEAMLKELRMNGLASQSPDILEKMDHRVKERGRGSVVFPLSFNKDGSCSKSSAVTSEENFRLMSDFASEKMKEIGSRILQGEVKVSPYQLGNRKGCEYCEYRPVCGFDERIRGYEYRRLKSFSDEEIWEQMKRRCGRNNELDEGTGTGNPPA